MWPICCLLPRKESLISDYVKRCPLSSPIPTAVTLVYLSIPMFRCVCMCVCVRVLFWFFIMPCCGIVFVAANMDSSGCQLVVLSLMPAATGCYEYDCPSGTGHRSQSLVKNVDSCMWRDLSDSKCRSSRSSSCPQFPHINPTPPTAPAAPTTPTAHISHPSTLAISSCKCVTEPQHKLGSSFACAQGQRQRQRQGQGQPASSQRRGLKTRPAVRYAVCLLGALATKKFQAFLQCINKFYSESTHSTKTADLQREATAGLQ